MWQCMEETSFANEKQKKINFIFNHKRDDVLFCVEILHFAKRNNIEMLENLFTFGILHTKCNQNYSGRDRDAM
jgi:hypothetical protein